MLKINKGEPIHEFVNLMKQKDEPKVWEEVPTDVRFKMKCTMLSCEQNNLCGYTELPLKNDNSHIDHFRKRSMFPELTFKWDNFVIASIDEGFGAKFKDNHSNLTKKDYDIIFNPVEQGLDSFVQYETDGMMTPIDKKNQRVKRTIDVFNLNDSKLKMKRNQIMRCVDSCYKGGMNDDDIRSWLKKEGFPSVVEWELNQLKEVS